MITKRYYNLIHSEIELEIELDSNSNNLNE
jgi:hypothetical protein